MAQQIGLERTRLKKVLAGQEPMTVDELIQISESLELDAQALAQLKSPPVTPPPDKGSIAERKQTDPPTEESSAAIPFHHSLPDPYGNHAEQLMQMAFDLGCDIFCHLDSSLIKESGIPESVQSRFPEFLPLRLEAVYHHHNQPVFKPNGLQLLLSFDSLYTCTLPWACFQQITLFPIRWEPTEEEPIEESPEPAGDVPHLRLVD
jgi:hypothetical protein